VPIQIVVRHIYQSGDVALVVSDWTIQGKTPSGDSVELAGTATDVLRKSRSKGWFYIIDNPFGGQQPQQ
jgi:ketosteroid isomerase-like protein